MIITLFISDNSCTLVRIVLFKLLLTTSITTNCTQNKIFSNRSQGNKLLLVV